MLAVMITVRGLADYTSNAAGDNDLGGLVWAMGLGLLEAGTLEFTHWTSSSSADADSDLLSARQTARSNKNRF